MGTGVGSDAATSTTGAATGGGSGVGVGSGVGLDEGVGDGLGDGKGLGDGDGLGSAVAVVVTRAGTLSVGAVVSPPPVPARAASATAVRLTSSNPAMIAHTIQRRRRCDGRTPTGVALWCGDAARAVATPAEAAALDDG